MKANFAQLTLTIASQTVVSTVVLASIWSTRSLAVVHKATMVEIAHLCMILARPNRVCTALAREST